jgi:hypothetical protein
LQEISSAQSFNDINFWINAAVSLLAFIGIFMIGWLKKDISNLYNSNNANTTDIGIIKKDLENHRNECDKQHVNRK